MTKFCGYQRLGLALSLFLALSAQTASAGSIAMQLTVGATVINIDKGGIYDTSDPFNDNVITVNTAQLNADLATAGHSNLTFAQGLGASSNNIGTSTVATLSQNGSATVSSGTVTFSLVAFQTDFFLPAGSNGVLDSNDGGNFTTTNPLFDKTSFTSYFSADNSGTVATGLASPTLSFLAPASGNGSYSDNATSTPLGTISGPYALVNEINVTVSGSTSKQGSIGWSASTLVTATAVPEPASVVTMMSAFPIAFGLIRRYRRGAKNSK